MENGVLTVRRDLDYGVPLGNVDGADQFGLNFFFPEIFQKIQAVRPVASGLIDIRKPGSF